MSSSSLSIVTVMRGSCMQSLPQVGCAVSGDRSDREQLMHKCLRVRLGNAEGIGEEGDGLAHLLGNAVMALLNIPQHPGLKGTVRLLRIPLDAVDAARVEVSAQISQIVERIGMGPDLYQAGVCHLPAHIPAEEVVSGHVLHIHHNRDHGFHLVCLKQREEQLVVAPVSVVKGDEKGFFRQRLSPCQLPRQHSVVAMFRQPAQVLFHTAHGDGHIVARLTVLHDMVVHQHREGPVRRNGHLPHSPGIESRRLPP